MFRLSKEMVLRLSTEQCIAQDKITNLFHNITISRQHTARTKDGWGWWIGESEESGWEHLEGGWIGDPVKLKLIATKTC
jgi:hypothetical protein